MRSIIGRELEQELLRMGVSLSLSSVGSARSSAELFLEFSQAQNRDAGPPRLWRLAHSGSMGRYVGASLIIPLQY